MKVHLSIYIVIPFILATSLIALHVDSVYFYHTEEKRKTVEEILVDGNIGSLWWLWLDRMYNKLIV